MNSADILTLKVVGSRGGATRVRIQAMQGSSFNGETGTIARISQADDGHFTAYVRLDRGGAELPFAPNELTELPAARPGR